jgi:hypothetical protein
LDEIKYNEFKHWFFGDISFDGLLLPHTRKIKDSEKETPKWGFWDKNGVFGRRSSIFFLLGKSQETSPTKRKSALLPERIKKGERKFLPR